MLRPDPRELRSFTHLEIVIYNHSEQRKPVSEGYIVHVLSHPWFLDCTDMHKVIHTQLIMPFVSFLVTLILRHSETSNLKEKGLLLAHSWRCRQPCWEVEAAGAGSSRSQEAESDEHRLLRSSLSPFTQSRIPASGDGPVHSDGGSSSFPNQNNPSLVYLQAYCPEDSRFLQVGN